MRARKLNFRYVARSETGPIRVRNEDCHLTGEGLWNDSQGYLFVVCDGNGIFHKEDNSSTAQTIVSEFYADTSIDRPFEQANEKLILHNKVRDTIVGSTAVAALLHDNQIYLANFGDSKGILLQNNDIKFITPDPHNELYKMIQKEVLNEEDMEYHHIFIDALRVGLGWSKEVEVNLSKFPLQQENRILLCTDGFSPLDESKIFQNITISQIGFRLSDESEIFQILKTNSIQNVCVDLFARLEKTIFSDNATALIIEISH